MTLGYDSFANARSLILERAYEDPDDSAGDFYESAGVALVQAWRDLFMRHPWHGFIKDPPGAFVTTDDATGTLTISSTGTSVSGTLAAAPTSSYAGRKMVPNGKTWVARVTAHTANTTTVTFDAIPETLSAVTATFFQDEYDLASDLGCLVDGLWAGTHFVELWGEARLKAEYPDPPSSGDYPVAFARLTRRKIRLSHYPAAIKRYEYPYSYEPSDPSGSGTVELEAHLRMAWAEKAYALLLDMKVDRRYREAELRAEQLIERAIHYETRRRLGFGQGRQIQTRGAYGS